MQPSHVFLWLCASTSPLRASNLTGNLDSPKCVEKGDSPNFGLFLLGEVEVFPLEAQQFALA
jgi:hypothetical protein